MGAIETPGLRHQQGSSNRLQGGPWVAGGGCGNALGKQGPGGSASAWKCFKDCGVWADERGPAKEGLGVGVVPAKE